ncbi:hypothetical protein GCM10009606_34940 [Nocardioides aquiterrae]|uniref:Uncharacterized protein n=1 Tax=Nocardioides aquiterrae TaxID=203799 RepID=A0ABN1UIK5_9ACTN
MRPELAVVADGEPPGHLPLEPVLRLLGDLHPPFAGLLAERRRAARPRLGRGGVGALRLDVRRGEHDRDLLAVDGDVGGLPVRREPAGEPARHALPLFLGNHVIIVARLVKLKVADACNAVSGPLGTRCNGFTVVVTPRYSRVWSRQA